MRLSPRVSALVTVFATLVILFGGCGSSSTAISSYDQARKAALDTVQAGRFDGGRMWTFDYPPVNYFKEEYGFSPEQAWLDDVRMSALRFANYCSASFVSSDGLVMTNHHCARQSVEEVQKEGEHLVENGYWAPTLEDERPVKGLYVDQLVEIRDVTQEVISAMEMKQTDDDKIAARREKVAEIEKRVSDETKLRAQVVTLYAGGKYSVYVYKRYEDVRLVFAPELQIGYFGGDFDNFTFPRYNLDFSFFRVYGEDGKPLKSDHHFTWSKSGAKEGEPVFVVGNPGSTSRLNTSAQLEYNRDFQYPFISGILDDRVAVLQKYSELHPEKRTEMINEIFGISNSQKAYAGQLAGLRDDVLMQRRKDFDKKFHAEVERRPELKAKYGHVWEEIAESRAKMRSVAPDLLGLRMNGLGIAAHMSKAAGIVRFAMEMAKPDEERAKPYQGKNADLTKRTLIKAVEDEEGMEEFTLAKQLLSMKRWLGANDPVILKALGGMSVDDAAKSMLGKTVLGDADKVKALVEGGPTSIETSADPFIAVARVAIPRQVAAQKVSDVVRAKDQVNQSLLGRALFDVYGTSIPPDATFTLRLADGIVKGFEYNGTKAPPYTTFYGMYDRYYSFKGEEAWDLPDKWKTPTPDFDLGTPINFVSTNDIIGGNSGSPMINRQKEVVGLIFDGNIESLPGDYIFAPDAKNRTVSVHSSGMVEALRHVYKATRLANELQSSRIAN